MIENTFNNLSQKGFRVLGISYRYIHNKNNSSNTPLHISKQDEYESIFLGFLVLSGPIRNEVPEYVRSLRQLGISLKIISGDNYHIASFGAKEVGLPRSFVLTGSELDKNVSRCSCITRK
jgi:P-type Mg2+ transporter